MPRVRFAIEPSSRVVVTARSSVHDTETVWSSMSGHIEVDPEDLEAGADAEISVDMAKFDAGDWLKNRKLKKDLDVARHPTALFRLTGLSGIEDQGDKTAASATGKLSWRGHEVEIEASGSAKIDSSSIEATARFEFDVREVGVKPPKILMLKVEEIVSVVVELRARAS